MNEQVKKLMAQTLDEKFSHTWTALDYQDLEKFSDYLAELIVQDILSICESERDGYLKLRKSTLEFDEKNIYAEGEAACDRIRIMAKRRFGVK